jgi:hypothetical protein
MASIHGKNRDMTRELKITLGEMRSLARTKRVKYFKGRSGRFLR